MSDESEYKLKAIERNVLIVAAKTDRNFDEIARVLLLKSPIEAKEIYSCARQKLLYQIHGGPESWKSAGQIARTLKAADKWVLKRVNEKFSQLSVILPSGNGTNVAHYPAKVVNELHIMRKQHLSIPVAGDHVSLIRLASLVGKSHQWVSKQLEDLSIKPIKRRDATGRVSNFYALEVISLVEELCIEYPPPGDWLTVYAISKQLGADWTWVENTIKNLNISGELRQIPPFEKLAMHFPSDTLGILRTIYTQYPPAAGWITAHALVAATGKSHNWVKLRLTGEKNEIRKDEHGVPRKHFPPKVLSDLKSRIAEDNRGKRPRAKS